jgi:hypothetical protein
LFFIGLFSVLFLYCLRFLEQDKRALTRIPLEVSKLSEPHSSGKRMTSPKTSDDVLPISEEELCKTWSQLITDWDSNVKKKSKYIRELAWKGIPNPMRSLVWPLLAGVNMAYSPLKEMYPKLLAVSRSVCEMCVRSPVVCELSLA